jgi:hypothetical protein
MRSDRRYGFPRSKMPAPTSLSRPRVFFHEAHEACASHEIIS